MCICILGGKSVIWYGLGSFGRSRSPYSLVRVEDFWQWGEKKKVRGNNFILFWCYSCSPLDWNLTYSDKSKLHIIHIKFIYFIFPYTSMLGLWDPDRSITKTPGSLSDKNTQIRIRNPYFIHPFPTIIKRGEYFFFNIDQNVECPWGRGDLYPLYPPHLPSERDFS